MIPRLSGQGRLSERVTDEALPLMSRPDAQKIIQQFFSLIKHLSMPEMEMAPETKRSRKQVDREKFPNRTGKAKP